MGVFLVLGIAGTVVLVASLVLGDLLEGVLGGVDLGGGVFSTEVLGAFLAAFGFGAALLDGPVGLATGAAVAGGAAAGVVLGGVALWASRSLLRMHTDATPRASDLVGALGRVVTRIPVAGLGEVSVVVAGARTKLSARAAEPIASGTEVVVVEVLSPTAVLVAEAGLRTEP